MLWLLAAALLVRALIPAGYMFSWEQDGVSVMFCDGVVPPPSVQKPMAMMAHHAHHDQGAPDKKPVRDEQPCSFAAVSSAAATAVDPLILATAIVFILATVAFGVLAEKRSEGSRAYLRPPLRGPPARI